MDEYDGCELMIDYEDIYRRIQQYRITRDEDMPKAYRFSNPIGRPYHDDWKLKGVPDVLQPWTKIKRMDTSYRVPFPFIRVTGTQEPKWVPYQDGYPLAPNTEIRMMPYFNGEMAVDMPHILMMEPVPPRGKWAVSAAFIDNEWRACYYSSKLALPFGYSSYTNRGVKPDCTLGDFFCSAPEGSWNPLKKEKSQ